jgi:histidine triad (HIT) family protein
MDDCIFCKIIRGEIPCYKVYENSDVLAFLDINPLSKGHILVLPKNHYATIIEIPSDKMCEVQKAVKMVAEKIQDKYKPLGIFVNQNNGEKAGQEVHHYHVHIKPVYEDTPMHNEGPLRSKFSEEEMLKILEDLEIT